MKTIFWHQGHPDVPCTPCPFLGVKVKDLDDFINFVKTRLYRTGPKFGHYPCVIFNTKYSDCTLVFRGSLITTTIPINPLTGVPYRWWLADENNNIIRFFSKESFEEMFECFDDAIDIDTMVKAVNDIIEREGKLEVQL